MNTGYICWHERSEPNISEYPSYIKLTYVVPYVGDVITPGHLMMAEEALRKHLKDTTYISESGLIMHFETGFVYLHDLDKSLLTIYVYYAK